MTNAADIFDALVTRIGTTLLSAHHRLPNPYELAENNGRLLEKGWGLAVSPGGENTSRFICATRSVRIQFQIVLTRRFYATENDASAKASADKLLLTDFETIIDDSHQNNMNVSGLNVVSGFFGIQSVNADQDLYRALICNMTVEYFRY